MYFWANCCETKPRWSQCEQAHGICEATQGLATCLNITYLCHACMHIHPSSPITHKELSKWKKRHVANWIRFPMCCPCLHKLKRYNRCHTDVQVLQRSTARSTRILKPPEQRTCKHKYLPTHMHAHINIVRTRVFAHTHTHTCIFSSLVAQGRSRSNHMSII